MDRIEKYTTDGTVKYTMDIIGKKTTDSTVKYTKDST